MHHVGMSYDPIIVFMFSKIKEMHKNEIWNFEIKTILGYSYEFPTTDLLRVTLVSVKES